MSYYQVGDIVRIKTKWEILFDLESDTHEEITETALMSVYHINRSMHKYFGCLAQVAEVRSNGYRLIKLESEPYPDKDSPREWNFEEWTWFNYTLEKANYTLSDADPQEWFSILGGDA